MRKYLTLIIVSILVLSGCRTAYEYRSKHHKWFSIALAEGVEIHVDTASIKPMGSVTYAFEKRVYTTPEAKEAYISKIRAEYEKMGKAEKIDKWKDFSYNVYYSLYDCTNQRFRVLVVEDFDSAGNSIIRTTPPKNKMQWLNVENETVGDYTFFFVCDYGQ